MRHTFALARVEDSDTDTENAPLIRLPTAFFYAHDIFYARVKFPFGMTYLHAF